MASKNPVWKAVSNLVLIVTSIGSVVGIIAVVGATITNAVIATLLVAVFVASNTAYILWKGVGATADDNLRMSAYYDIAYGDTTNWLPWMVGVNDPRYSFYQEYLDRFCRATPHLDPEDRDEHLKLVEGLRDRSKINDEDAFARGYYEFRKTAKAKYERLVKRSS